VPRTFPPGACLPSWGDLGGLVRTSSTATASCPEPPHAEDVHEFEPAAVYDLDEITADVGQADGVEVEVLSISGVKICHIVQQRDCTVQELQSAVAQLVRAPIAEVQLVLGATMLCEPSARPLSDLPSPATPVMLYMIRKNTRCKKGVWLRNRKLPKSCVSSAGA